MIQTLLFFLQGVPEIAGIVACSLALARVRLRWGIILSFACILAVVIYIIRNMPVTFGLHTVISILLCALFVTKFTKVPPSTSFTVVFAGYAILALLEVTMHELFSSLLHTEVSQLISDDYIWKLIGFPHAIFMIAIALAIAKYKKPLESMWRV
ncbi:hypothetical protein ABDB91_16525 [Desulfoscipio sp. XC116]|uniref:hypothetical protein n=1 Tax=Desulfoscipio sp. XC116 TaxID=3144975 RepID=UPI00325ABFD7